jgi:hypothetical protein
VLVRAADDIVLKSSGSEYHLTGTLDVVVPMANVEVFVFGNFVSADWFSVESIRRVTDGEKSLPQT